jgi:tetratricopeptide (TPR) repeat protein
MRLCILIPLIIFGLLSHAQNGNDYYQRALEFKEQRDFENALVYVRKALLFDSVNADFYDLKAQCYRLLKKDNEAFLTYTDGIKKNPGDAFLYFQRGHVLLNIEKYNESIKDFTKALELTDNDSIRVYAYTYRAGAKESMRNFHGSYDDLMLSYKLDSNNLITLTSLGTICDDIGKMDDAIKYLVKAIELKPDYIPAIINLGFKYQQTEQHEKAIEYYNKALQLQPNQPLGYSNRGYSRLKLGDTKGAMEDINISLGIYPANSYAYRIRALIYIEMKDIDNACTDLNTALEKGFTARYGDEVEKLKKKYCKAD